MHDDEMRTQAEADIEQEIRQRRKFSATEAMSRLAGPGAMKGASPISPQQQAENEIAGWLQNHFADPAGVLRAVLSRGLRGSERLIRQQDQPLKVLAEYCSEFLASDYRLKELVREVDAQWGEQMDERPYFDREGAPPHPDDPYSTVSVRQALDDAVRQLMDR